MGTRRVSKRNLSKKISRLNECRVVAMLRNNVVEVVRLTNDINYIKKQERKKAQRRKKRLRAKSHSKKK